MEGYKIRPNMRSILVDWLVDVHGRFKLLQETLYLAVSIMDRFCQVFRASLASFGIASMSDRFLRSIQPSRGMIINSLD